MQTVPNKRIDFWFTWQVFNIYAVPIVSGTLSILEKWRSLRYYLLLPDAHGLVRETKLTHNEKTKGKSKTASQWRCQEWRSLRERWTNDLGWWTLKGRNVSTLKVERNKDRAEGVVWTQVPAFRAVNRNDPCLLSWKKHKTWSPKFWVAAYHSPWTNSLILTFLICKTVITDLIWLAEN